MTGTNFVLDLSNYKDRVGARVEPGRYRVVVDDCEMDKSKAGNPMVNVWLRIVGTEFDGATLTDRLTITDKALFRVVGFMQAIGLPTPKKRVQIDLRQFTGKTLDVDVEDGDPYNGRIKSEVRGYIRIAGAKAAAEEATDLDDIAAASAPAAAVAAGDPDAVLAAAAAPAVAVVAAPVAAAEVIDSGSAPEEVDLATLDLG